MPENNKSGNGLDWDDLLSSFSKTTGSMPSPEEQNSNVRISIAEKNAADDEKNRSKKLENDEKESIISLRKWLSIIVTCGVILWMIFVGLIVMGVACRWFGAVLSDTVLLALVGGSTANILGMLTIILIFLFPPKHNAHAKCRNYKE
ncbi:MAG TPA: hypothetical protein DDZ11_12740 [Lentisphaeria bacterium]|nr:hypothetical protein [Lentisphaeria bacterium]